MRTATIFIVSLLLCSSSLAKWNIRCDSLKLGTGQTPYVASGPTGNVHLIYTWGTTMFYFRINSSGIIEIKESFVLSEDKLFKPALAIDENDVPHVIFQKDYTRLGRGPYYTNRIGGQWKQLVLLDNIEDKEEPVDMIRVNNLRMWVRNNVAYIGYMGGHDKGASLRVINLDSVPIVSHRNYNTHMTNNPFPGNNGKWYLSARRKEDNFHQIWEYDNKLFPILPRQAGNCGTTDSRTSSSTACYPWADGHEVYFCGTMVIDDNDENTSLWINTLSRVEKNEPCILGPEFYGFEVNTHICYSDDTTAYISLATKEDNKIYLYQLKDGTISEPVLVATDFKAPIRWSPKIAALREDGVIISRETIDNKVILVSYGNCNFRLAQNP